jgi:hypothetical protein
VSINIGLLPTFHHQFISNGGKEHTKTSVFIEGRVTPVKKKKELYFAAGKTYRNTSKTCQTQET